MSFCSVRFLIGISLISTLAYTSSTTVISGVNYWHESENHELRSRKTDTVKPKEDGFVCETNFPQKKNRYFPQHQGILRFVFHISNLFNMAVGKRQSIKKQFSSYHRVFYHSMSSTQSECSNPLIFYEQRTTHLGM